MYHRVPKRIHAHALVCYLALILHQVLRMRLTASNGQESAGRLLEQLRRIQHQTAQAGDGEVLCELTELDPVQKELLVAIGLQLPTPVAVRPPDEVWITVSL